MTFPPLPRRDVSSAMTCMVTQVMTRPRTDYARDLASALGLHTGTARRYLAEWRRQTASARPWQMSRSEAENDTAVW